MYVGHCANGDGMDRGVHCLECCRAEGPGSDFHGRPEVITRLKLAYKAAMQKNKYDLILKCDDNTRINYNNFVLFLRSIDYSARAVYGQCVKTSWEPRPFCGGGAGVLAPTSLIQDMLLRWPRLGPEDVAFSNLASDLGARLINIAGFEPECTKPYIASITLHHCYK